MQAIRQDPERERFYQQVLHVARRETRDRIELVICPQNRNCQVNDELFTDYGHLHRDGAGILTATLHREIASRSE
jgi:hypothetical protein